MSRPSAPSYYIRPFRQSDTQQVRDLFVETHDHAMAELSADLRQLVRIAMAGEVGSRLSDPQRYYADPPNHFILICPAEQPEEVAAYCALVRLNEREVELKNVIAAPKRQGAGLGTMLMDAAEEQARKDDYERIVLWTYAHLKVATGIYLRRGYQEKPLVRHPDMMMELQPLYMELQLRQPAAGY